MPGHLLLLSLALLVSAFGPSLVLSLPGSERPEPSFAPAAAFTFESAALVSTSTLSIAAEPTGTPTRQPTKSPSPLRPTNTPSPTPVPPTPTHSFARFTDTPTRVQNIPSPTPVSPTPTYYFLRFTATPTRGTRTPQPTSAPARPTGDFVLLPDLRMLPPADFTIETTPDNIRLLRLTNYIMNWGPGQLEILGVSDPVSQRTVVTQHLYRVNGTFTNRPAGIFVFHPSHDHWHLENFARYEIWSLTSEGVLNENVALAAKVSYCLRDTGRSTLPGAPANPLYLECLDKLQGISVGWIDSYEYDIPDQTVDITALADGVYAVRCIVDPGDLFLETNENNNTSLSYIHITGDTVRQVDRQEALTLINAAQ